MKGINNITNSSELGTHKIKKGCIVDKGEIDQMMLDGQKLPTAPLDKDGATDLLHMWNSEEYSSYIEEELESGTDKPVITEHEKDMMAKSYEPFNVLDVELVDTKYGARWKITVELQDGTEKYLLMGSHKMRDSIINAIQHRITTTQGPVKNVALVFQFESQGNNFYVLRPWVNPGSKLPGYAEDVPEKDSVTTQ